MFTAALTTRGLGTVQTPTRPKSDSGFESGLIRIGCLLDHSQNVLDLFSCWCVSFRQVSETSAGDCMRNANKS